MDDFQRGPLRRRHRVRINSNAEGRPMSELISDEIADWHRRLCRVTDWLYLCGDLPEGRQELASQLAEWVEAGVTDIVDVREEWTDEKLVHQFAPHVRY